jgi:hypothetical protein
MELVYTRKGVLLETIWITAGEWVDVDCPQRAENLHSSGAAFSVHRLKQLLEELADTKDETREQDIVGFLIGFLFGMPLEAADHYGTWSLTEYARWQQGEKMQLSEKIQDNYVRTILQQLLDELPQHVVEIQETPPPKKEKQVKQRKKVSK